MSIVARTIGWLRALRRLTTTSQRVADAQAESAANANALAALERELQRMRDDAAVREAGSAAEMAAREASAAAESAAREASAASESLARAERAAAIEAELREAVDAQARVLADMREDLAAHGANVGGIDTRIAAVEQALERLDPPMPVLSGAGAAETGDWMYASFEDSFRGTRDEIKGRHAIYLPRIRASAAGTAMRPVLDVGCGRGEWLELLAAEHMTAAGVDASAIVVRACRERGLDARNEDAITMLRGEPEGAWGALTAFHLVEHLPFPRLIALLAEAHRVLAAGGLLILETPNPNNFVVGSNGFWLDPTHLRPLPPALLRFAAEIVGFKATEVLPLHPDDAGRADAAAANWPPALADLVYGARDYALIARKPESA